MRDGVDRADQVRWQLNATVQLEASRRDLDSRVSGAYRAAPADGVLVTLAHIVTDR